MFRDDARSIFIGLCSGAILGIILHEAAHTIAILFFGGKIEAIILSPYIQIYPEIRFLPFNNHMGDVIHTPQLSDNAEGLIALSGSGLTGFIALWGLFLIQKISLKKSVRIVTTIMFLIFAWDIISYSILPNIGLLHWGFIGGETAEPLIGALLLGINWYLYFGLLSIYFGIIHLLAYKNLKSAFSEETND